LAFACGSVSQQPTQSLFLRLGASRQLVCVLGGLHLGAAACGFANDLPLAIQILLVTCALLHGRYAVALHGTRRATRSIVFLIWDAQGRWRLLQRDGKMLDASLEHGACSHPRLLTLPFRSRCGRHLCVLIAADMVAADGLRRLRVRLRCEPQPSPQDGSPATLC
jgi:hypothetical protein